jgi:maleamate amidohydrolase
VIVTGCTTSGCVRASVVDAFSNGFLTLVPEDAVGDQDQGPHEANLLDCQRRYAEVTTTDACIEYVERLAAA